MGTDETVGEVFLDSDLLGPSAHPVVGANELSPVKKPLRQLTIADLGNGIIFRLIPVSIILTKECIIGLPRRLLVIDRPHQIFLLFVSKDLQQVAEARHGFYLSPWNRGIPFARHATHTRYDIDASRDHRLWQ